MKLALMKRIARRLDRELVTSDRPSKWDDMAELGALLTAQRGTWKEQMHELWLNGQPLNVAGGLAGLEGQLSPATDVTITLPLAETAIIPVAYTPIGAGRTSPTVWQLFAPVHDDPRTAYCSQTCGVRAHRARNRGISVLDAAAEAV